MSWISLSECYYMKDIAFQCSYEITYCCNVADQASDFRLACSQFSMHVLLVVDLFTVFQICIRRKDKLRFDYLLLYPR